MVYSKEEPIKVRVGENIIDKRVEVEELDKINDASEISSRKQVPGSISFVPSVAGLIIAGEVVKDIIKPVI